MCTAIILCSCVVSVALDDEDGHTERARTLIFGPERFSSFFLRQIQDTTEAANNRDLNPPVAAGGWGGGGGSAINAQYVPASRQASNKRCCYLNAF